MIKNRIYDRKGNKVEGLFEVVCDLCHKHLENGWIRFDKKINAVIEVCRSCHYESL